MNLIDETYFVLELEIPARDKEGVRDTLNGFVTKYQKRFLISLLGEACYNDFMAGLAAPDIDQKWIDLRNKLVDTTTLESPIANYVYFYYRLNAVTSTSDTGELIAVNENSKQASSFPKRVHAWNELVGWIELNRAWLETFLVDNGYLPAQPNYLNGVSIWWPCHSDKNYPFTVINTFNL